MSSNSADGIQALLAAETEAQRIVAAARAEKSTKLKQAREEAEREISAYKAELEDKYQARLTQETGSSGANVQRLDVETKTKILEVNQKASANQSKVVDLLMKMVTHVPAPVA